MAVTEAAIVLMFSTHKKDVEENFFVLGVGFCGRVGTIAIFFCNFSVMIV